MKTLLRFCVLIAVLIVMLPVSAQSSSHECAHSGTNIGELQLCVNHAAQKGHIDSAGTLRALLAKLDAADRAYDRGQARVAVNNLQAFIYLVEAQSGKHIDPNHASHMINHAQLVIDNIG